jgi:hypothetical protein
VDAARGVTARPRVGVGVIIDRRVSGIMDADAEEHIVVVVVDVEVTVVDTETETKNVVVALIGPNARRSNNVRARVCRATAGRDRGPHA